MTAQPGARQVAYATLAYLTQPANPLLGGLLRVLESADVVAEIRPGALPAALIVTLDAVQ